MLHADPRAPWRLLGRVLLAGALVIAGLTDAAAEVLDELEVFPERTDAVVRIVFSVRIQYLRHVIVGGDSADIFFQIISADAPPSTVEERRRIAPTAAFPGVTVAFPVLQDAGSRRITVRFSAPVEFRVRPAGGRAIDLVVPGAGKDVIRRPTPGERVAAGAEAAQFAIRLERFATPEARLSRPVPSQFQDYAVFTSQTVQDGRVGAEVLLGYFATAEAAERARLQLSARFPDAEVVDLGQRREEALGAVAAQAAPAPPVAAPPPADVERRAAELMARGRAALNEQRYEAAVELFNQLLILPPNLQSQEAQELVGLARERGGELAKARAEYELYLKLFPEGEGAERVRRRLAGLGAAPAAGAPARAERPPLRTLTGSVSQYYYGGKTRAETAFNTPTTVDRATFSATDQSALVSDVDLHARYRTGESDTRLVFRDTYTLSFLDRRPSFNRLNAAYYDYRALQGPLTARLGRQTGLTAGLPNRFDGGIVGHAIGRGAGARLRANAVAGLPVEYPSIDSDRFFVGANLEFEGLADVLYGNAFIINQQVDGILDRRAVGGEIRYFDAARSLYSLVDYDVSYHVLNIAMAQGSWQTEGKTTVNVLLDRRRAPLLTTTNAIFGQSTTSISTLLQTLTEDQVRQQARDVTATATQALLGFTTPVSEKWQLGADLRLTNVGALPATVVNGVPVPAQPATGNIYSYLLQAIGTGLYSARDTNAFGLTFVTSPTLDGWQLAYNNRTLLDTKWSLEPSIRYYTQRDTFGLRLERLTPGLRVSFRVRDSVALESELNWEKSKTTGPGTRDDTSRTFFYFGYRWDI